MKQKKMIAKSLAVAPLWLATVLLVQGCQTNSAKQPSPVGPEKSSQTSAAKNADSEQQVNTVNTEIKSGAVSKPVKPAKPYSSEKSKSVAKIPDSAKQNKQSQSGQKENKQKESEPKESKKVKQPKTPVVEKPVSSSVTAKNQASRETIRKPESQSAIEPVANPEVLKETQPIASNTKPATAAAVNGGFDKQITPKSPEETQLALAEPSLTGSEGSVAKEAAVTDIEKINLSIDMLPHSFGSWVLEHNWDNQHPNKCRLRSLKTAINDGYENTFLWAEILPDEINIYTGSNIDLDYEGSGLQFGSKPVQSFTGFLTETAVNIAGNYRESLQNSDTLTVYLGFWPTWPKTEIQKVILPAQELVQAMPVFDACQTWSE